MPADLAPLAPQPVASIATQRSLPLLAGVLAAACFVSMDSVIKLLRV